MTPEITPLVAGNWKMNGLLQSLEELEAVSQGYDKSMQGQLDILVCVPATLIREASQRLNATPVSIGGQDCHFNQNGAHTGDISGEMIADSGGSAVIVGHSERRTDHGESNGLVRKKAEAGIRAGLLTIICIGETEEQRKQGQTLDVLKEQLEGSVPDGVTSSDTVIAYEPVWAIGTGLTPTVHDIAEVHGFIRAYLEGRFGESGSHMRILYGGSVKPGNAVELMAVEHVDGALVGGASLKSEDFLGICQAYSNIA